MGAGEWSVVVSVDEDAVWVLADVEDVAVKHFEHGVGPGRVMLGDELGVPTESVDDGVDGFYERGELGDERRVFAQFLRAGRESLG
ncbi:hypothetical protein C5B95_07125 [Rathayibacter sp. AY1A7]|nr:hypothetical protein C5B95_07125 [Rathayibacter sp. AY1A7]